MKSQIKKNNDPAGIDIQIPGQMSIEDFPEYLPTGYLVGGAVMRTGVSENSFEANKDCFGYCKENNTCSVLNKLWCKVEKCKFYKTKEQFESERTKYGFVRNFIK